MGSLGPASVTARRSRAGVVAALALFCAASIALAGYAGYLRYRPAGRSADGVVVSPGRVSVHDTRVGDCFTDRPTFGLLQTYLHAVPCDSAHRTEAYAITVVPGLGGYPGDAGVNDLARAACSHYSLPAATTALPGVWRSFIRPTARTWAQGDRRVTCMIGGFDERAGRFGGAPGATAQTAGG